MSPDSIGSSRAAPAPAQRFRWFLAPALALGALLASLFFYSPRLWAFMAPMPGSTYWDRGLQFMRQCDSPFGTPLQDAGLVWRLAPMALAKLLGLHGSHVFLVPWIGVPVLLTLCAWLALKRTGDVPLAALTALLVGTTQAVLTVTGWLGMNDAWNASALLVIAFVPSWPGLVLAALLGPWIDERFILALPLALWVRHRALGAGARMGAVAALSLGSVALYTVLRLGDFFHLTGAASNSYWLYIRGHGFDWWPWTSLGWFMGLRAAWILVAIAIGGRFRRDDLPAMSWPVLFAAAPLLTINCLAADTGRAPTMLLPLVLLGLEQTITLWGLDRARRLLVGLVVANLILPAMHVTYRYGDIINMLPMELIRLWRHG